MIVEVKGEGRMGIINKCGLRGDAMLCVVIFNSYPEKPPHLVAFYDTLGIRMTHSRLNPTRGDYEVTVLVYGQ